jgi:hypothetical protein
MRSDQKLRRQYLENIAMDIEREMDLLHLNDVQVQQRANSIREIRPAMNVNGANRDSAAGKFFELARVINFVPINTTYQVLINSGDMKLIRDFELRRSIEEHYALHGIILQDYDRIEEIHRKYIADFFIHDIDFNQVRQGNMDFFDKPLLRSIINSLDGAYQLVLSANARCLASNQMLLDKIREAHPELKRSQNSANE